MELSYNSKSSYLNKITYVNLRWIGVIGQFITILDGKTGEYEARIIEKGIRAEV